MPCSVRKTKCDAGPKHVRTVCDGKFRHPHRFSSSIYVDAGFFRSFYVGDRIFRHIHDLFLLHAWFFLQCDSD
jgi:hypothetical protein